MGGVSSCATNRAGQLPQWFQEANDFKNSYRSRFSIKQMCACCIVNFNNFKNSKRRRSSFKQMRTCCIVAWSSSKIGQVLAATMTKTKQNKAKHEEQTLLLPQAMIQATSVEMMAVTENGGAHHRAPIPAGASNKDSAISRTASGGAPHSNKCAPVALLHGRVQRLVKF